jgi:hypothetical protein
LELPKCINAQVACKERQQQAEIVFIGEAAGRHSRCRLAAAVIALINVLSEERGSSSDLTAGTLVCSCCGKGSTVLSLTHAAKPSTGTLHAVASADNAMAAACIF